MVLVFWPYYSYSDSIQPYYGTTPNAAATGNTWDMSTILPTPPGLDINGVIYNYIINKDVNDHVDVYVGNENANGTGYIFREHDEWKAGSLGGTEIRKVVPVIPNIPRASWGDGSIEVEGNGSVENPNVVYMYKVDPCFNPQYDPNCPGYETPTVDIPEVDLSTIYNATEDEAVQIAQTDTDVEYKEDENQKASSDEEDEEERKEMRLEAALAAIDNSELFATATAQSQILAAMNMAIQMNTYYATNIQGGVYKETVKLVDKQINDNKKGLRNGFAQQILHELMVDSQY